MTNTVFLVTNVYDGYVVEICDTKELAEHLMQVYVQENLYSPKEYAVSEYKVSTSR